MKPFRNPSYRGNWTEKKPLYVCRGDMVEAESHLTYDPPDGRMGTLWYTDAGWQGTGAAHLRPSTQEEIDWVPAHLRLLNKALGL